MPTLPWRFQADLTPDNPDPDVTVFVGDTVTNDVTGEKKVHQDTANPEMVKLSELSSYITTAMTSGVTRTKKAAPGEEMDEDEPEDEQEAPVRMTPKSDPKPAPKPMQRPAPKPVQRPASKPLPTGGQRR